MMTCILIECKKIDIYYQILLLCYNQHLLITHLNFECYFIILVIYDELNIFLFQFIFYITNLIQFRLQHFLIIMFLYQFSFYNTYILSCCILLSFFLFSYLISLLKYCPIIYILLYPYMNVSYPLLSSIYCFISYTLRMAKYKLKCRSQSF